MSAPPVTVHLPEQLYNKLKERAGQSRRSIEAELLDVVATAVPFSEELPPALAEVTASLNVLNDEDLWRAARAVFPEEAAGRLETLHLKQQREGLTPIEVEEADLLLAQYERVLLVRARAAEILRQRGVDVSRLLSDE